MVRHPSFQGLPWRYEFRQDLPVIPSVDHRCRRHRTAVSTTWRSPHTPHGVRPSDPSVLGFRFQTRHHRRHHAQQVRSGTCAGYADHRTRARARGTARRADGGGGPPAPPPATTATTARTSPTTKGCSAGGCNGMPPSRRPRCAANFRPRRTWRTHSTIRVSTPV